MEGVVLYCIAVWVGIEGKWEWKWKRVKWKWEWK
jgi:hypothetical protein